jgi:hypothetical protein
LLKLQLSAAIVPATVAAAVHAIIPVVEIAL